MVAPASPDRATWKKCPCTSCSSVCTGNICRSPTAERLAAAYAVQNGNPDITASSAGTRAVIGHPIHPDAAVVLEDAATLADLAALRPHRAANDTSDILDRSVICSSEGSGLDVDRGNRER